MRLFLVQHGKAKSKSEDPERSLSPEGTTETLQMAKFASENAKIKPDMIFHSGKTRAIQTAEIFAEMFEPTKKPEHTSGLSPMDPPSIWLDKLNEYGPYDQIMLVGHLPNLAKVAAILLSGDENRPIIHFQNSGIVCLEKNMEIENGPQWSLLWYIIPNILD
jgi:phosphohistidine phosphatase